MKILVPIKRVADPDNANKVRIGAGGQKIDTGNLEWKLNPFDEYALEAALRLNEDGKAPKTRLGEVIQPHPDSGLACVARTRQIAYIEDIKTQVTAAIVQC